LWAIWVNSIPNDGSVVHHAMLVATDEFQAATFNSLHGFYRVSVACLRAALEQMTIGVDCELRADKVEQELWLEGKGELLFGRACDTLQRQFLRTGLRQLFQQDDGKHKPGWLRALHDALSDYAHARPGFEALQLWEGSNGPIYVKSAFLWNVKMWLFTYVSCIFLVKIVGRSNTRPALILADPRIAEIVQLKSIADFLWP